MPELLMDGMTLRDWFAGQALVGLLAGAGGKGVDTVFAHEAYLVADAMLKQRETSDVG